MLYVMLGTPRSGKSTLCQNRRIGIDPIIINEDNIRLALTGQRYNKNVEDVVSMIKYTMIKTFLISKNDIIVDDTHTSIHSIQKIESLTEPNNIVWLIMETPKELCIDRAIKTNQEDLIPIIERMSKQKNEAVDYLYKKYVIDGTNDTTLEASLDCKLFSYIRDGKTYIKTSSSLPISEKYDYHSNIVHINRI